MRNLFPYTCDFAAYTGRGRRKLYLVVLPRTALIHAAFLFVYVLAVVLALRVGGVM